MKETLKAKIISLNIAMSEWSAGVLNDAALDDVLPLFAKARSIAEDIEKMAVDKNFLAPDLAELRKLITEICSRLDNAEQTHLSKLAELSVRGEANKRYAGTATLENL